MIAVSVGFGAVAAPLTAGAANKKHKTVEVTAQYKRTIEPADPSNVPASPPAVLPTATCVRKVGKQKETVFGYLHQGHYSWDTTPGNTTLGAPYNYFLVGKSAVADLGQLTQFLPGSHPSRFAVRTSKAPTWVLQVPEVGNERQFPNSPPQATWKISIKAKKSTCGASVPQHFALMRSTGAYVPIRHLSFGGNPFNPFVQGYSLEYTPSGGTTVCSPGGVPSAPRVLYGYPADFPDNFTPLTPDEVVRTDVFDGSSYTRSTVATRPVADVTQRVLINGVILDTWGRCQFGSQLVEAPDPTYGYVVAPAPKYLVRSDDATHLVENDGSIGGGVRYR